MLYRSMPRTGDELSILGFGCMRLPLDGEGKIDENRATALVRTAIDRGVPATTCEWNGVVESSCSCRCTANGYCIVCPGGRYSGRQPSCSAYTCSTGG